MNEAVKEKPYSRTELPSNYKMIDSSEQSYLDAFASNHPGNGMTHDELVELSKERLQGRRVSDIVLDERNEGY